MRGQRQRGFALLLVFAMMSAAAVMIYLQLPRFVMESQRAKEQLLIDRGEQYQRAIQLYYRKLKTWPQSLDDLEKGNNTRFLRKRYVDPFTGKAEWRLVHVNNGIYTDSLVYNNEPEKEKRQTFVAEMPSLGNNGAGDGKENVNLALRARASDRTSDPGAELPESVQVIAQNQLAQNQFPGNSSPPDPDEPRPLVFLPPGVASFEEFQRLRDEALRTGGTLPQLTGPQPSNPFPQAPGAPSPFPQGLGTPDPYPQNPTGAPYPQGPGSPFPQGFPGGPAIPGTVVAPGGFPTGINNQPPPPFGQTPPGSTGGGFIGGAVPVNGQPGFPNQFGQNGQPVGGFNQQGLGGGPGGVGAPNGQAAQLLNDAIFGPRPQGAAPGQGGTAAGGSGVVGVASKYEGETVKIYREKARFQHWEFIYDPAKDTANKTAAGQLPGAQNPPLPGGLPPGTATQPGGPLGPPGQQQPGNRAGQPGTGGFGATGGGGGLGTRGPATGGGGFIGGAPPAAGNPGGGATNNGQPRPGQPAVPQPNAPQPQQPPRPGGGGGFIGGR